MELFRSELYYIFVRKESSLWWNRVTGAFSVRSAWDLSDIEDIECLGITEAVKNVSNTIKSTTQQAATQVKQTVKKQRDPKLAERFEKRLTDELHKIFDDSDSFYYSRTLDITNSLQRQYEIEKILETEDAGGKTITDITRWWKHVDDRFFWNKHMLKDIIALDSPNCDQWILPVIQGYVHLSQIAVDPADSNPLNVESLSTSNSCDETFTLGLISRRSRYQAGTRYNRRGIEPGGKVANYVETEQIVSIICSDSIHRASFVQVRGSVPIFWSQPEYKFRPPPRLDRGEEETHAAFKKHFEEELKIYKHVCIVNLVEQQGRERVIWEAYGNHVLKYNSPDVIYATFDFHEYCRGMHYENVSILINAIADIIAETRFTWRDDRGLICGQGGVFRVNCIDCLDRTNVVQTAIAKYVLELQLCRLGLGTPGCGLPPSLRNAFLTMWADNGDVVSRQYAGTKALKGDYTRTGERKFTGMMKDGVASANRYYLSTFKDALRQVAIDVMTGESRTIPEQLIVPECSRCTSVKERTEPDTAAMAQHVKSLIDDCKKLLVDSEPVLGSWGLIDADPQTGNPHETETGSVMGLSICSERCLSPVSLKHSTGNPHETDTGGVMGLSICSERCLSLVSLKHSTGNPHETETGGVMGLSICSERCLSPVSLKHSTGNPHETETGGVMGLSICSERCLSPVSLKHSTGNPHETETGGVMGLSICSERCLSPVSLKHSTGNPHETETGGVMGLSIWNVA
ncbi:unnamed protein product, partial [Iphiclides podalirius]